MTPRMTPDERRDAPCSRRPPRPSPRPPGRRPDPRVGRRGRGAGRRVRAARLPVLPDEGALHAAVVGRWADAQGARVAAAVAAVPDGAPVRDRVRALLEVLLDDAARGELWWVDPGAFPAESLAAVAAARAAHGEVLRALLPPRWRRHEVALAGWAGVRPGRGARVGGAGLPRRRARARRRGDARRAAGRARRRGA